jgi:hypothetical protein
MDQRELIGEQEEAVRAAVKGFLMETWSALPGIVQSYDATRGTCVVQVAVKLQQLQVVPGAVAPAQTTTPVWITVPPIPDVPVVFIGGGGFVLEAVPAEGDECLLVFSSRCVGGWWANGGVQLQPVLRQHSMADGFAIIGPRSLPNVFSSLGPGIRLRTNDGTAYIELKPSGAVNIVAPGGVTVTGNLTVTGDVVADLSGSEFDGIPFASHVHTGVTSGGDNTGGPIA